LLNEEPHNLYSPPDILRGIKSRRVKQTKHKHALGEEISILIFGKSEGRTPLERPRHRWEVKVRKVKLSL
jgi:hypothetical protein